MQGLMQQHQLLVPSILQHAARFHRSAEIVSRRHDGELTSYSYPALSARVDKLASALQTLGVGIGDRVGTLAWNDHRHLETYFAVSGIGAICHTINPRLFEDQIALIITDARDRVLIVDQEFVPLIAAISDVVARAGVERVIVLSGTGDTVPDTIAGIKPRLYEALLEGSKGRPVWPDLDEETAAFLCYTSGTTGSPKGVLYSHRSTVLHSYAICLPDVFCLRATDRIMPVVPMYHVNAWGLPFAAALVGASLILPGARPLPADLLRLVREARVTFSAAVPTVWQGFYDELTKTPDQKLEALRIISGGAACPLSLIQSLTNEFGIQVNHAWGMTELSPVGLCNTDKPENIDAPRDATIGRQRKQGRPVYGINLRVVDADGADVAQDGVAMGELVASGPWVTRAYYNHDTAATDVEGWFHTGDIVTMDPSGYIEIADRAKDIVKSGGEWISSIALENLAASHPGVAEAAVIAAKHEKWGERPLLIVLPRNRSAPPARNELLAWFDGKVAKWWTPDDVVFVDSMPHTATGKLLKTDLKKRFADHLLKQST